MIAFHLSVPYGLGIVQEQDVSGGLFRTPMKIL